jgi:cytochrome c
VKGRGFVVCLVLVGSVGAMHAQDTMPKSTAAGVFTEEQAKRGDIAYHTNCAGCHGEKLRSIGPQFPDLTGKAFRTGWIGKTVGDRFEFIRKMMPPKAERSLADQVYLDILTYILQFNKTPAGAQPLTPDLERLKKIEIVVPSR